MVYQEVESRSPGSLDGCISKVKLCLNYNSLAKMHHKLQSHLESPLCHVLLPPQYTHPNSDPLVTKPTFFVSQNLEHTRLWEFLYTIQALLSEAGVQSLVTPSNIS